ncbi:MAG TPA: SDR family NAD(P)-dependent oxidoreductase [Thermoanaerobaculia bacterium]
MFNRYGSDGTVSRGTRRIAPNLFIGTERRGYFNYGRSNDIILVYGYAGPQDYLPALLDEMYRYCQSRGFQFNVMAGEETPDIGGVAFTANAFGAMQRVKNIKEFTIDGGPMRRLRYQLSKFQKSGVARTEEYRCGSNPETDNAIARVIDAWCAGKTMVNPLVHDVKGEILAGTLPPEHRLFLTYLDNILQNVIVITKMSEADNGYLMDLEFYPPDMPLGGLEVAIVEMITVLAAEGCDMLSLGGTYGCKLDATPKADPEIEKILDGLRERGIFNDQGNLQFKNKFRPENTTINLCRPAGSGKADNVIDIIMMIADPEKLQTSDAENFNFGKTPLKASAPVAAPRVAQASSEASSSRRTEYADTPVIPGNERSRILADYGFNPLNVPHEHVELDLKTDSWAQLHMPAVAAQMSHLRGQLQQPVSVDDSLRAIFPFAHFVLTASGQVAEHLFFKAWPRQGVVPQNLLFPSTIFHQIDKGFTPKEVPHAEVFRLASAEQFKGNLDWDALQAEVAKDPAAIAFVCLEVNDNAAGGYAVSLQHLREIKALLAPHSIPLVLDATRVVENAQFLIEQEKECAGKSLWAVVREIVSCADAVIGSLTKDFCVDKGGLIATNDAALYQRLQELIQEEGASLDLIDRKVIALALQNRKHIEANVLRRMEHVRLMWRALDERHVPVAHPAGGHCILIDVKQLPEFQALRDPIASFCAWLYLNTGIRAGAHSAGMQKQTSINDVVRLALPVGLKRHEVDSAIERLVRAFDEKANIPEIVMESSAPGPMGRIYAKYKLVAWHNVPELSAPVVEAVEPAAPVVAAAPGVAAAPVAKPVAPQPPVAAAPAATVTAPQQPVIPSVPPAAEPSRTLPKAEGRRTQDIAIIGMAGRYPKAKNVRELWANLAAGKDCIGDLPAERYEQRVQRGNTQRYRGGFIEDVDKFDSLFFNISPREAEMLDPQERLFLEVAWEAIEDAGYYPEIVAAEDASRKIGVYVGAVWSMYQIVGVDEKHAGNKVSPNSFLWSIANRVSYWMNFSGPSLTVDTACSSSLTALYLACEAIIAGDCPAALVGGVNLDLHQAKVEINQVGGALSADGVCRSFGKGANGYVAGEGIGALLLKPLDQAEKDGDHIYGVIKSAAVNHGGRTSGYFVPNPAAQSNVIVSALQKADIPARSIGYIEAHGTGTELGDPIEISGLSSAFSAENVAHQTCAIGSIKSNIGHLEAAAGVVSVSKVLLQMQHRQLVPSLHSSELNEFIDFAHSPFYVPQRLQKWKAKEIDGVRMPLRAGISSFGAGGANAHVILESYEPAKAVKETKAQTGELIFPLSARNEEQLREAAIRLAQFLAQKTVNLVDVAHTLQHGRKSFEYRVAIVATTQDELVGKLASFIEGRKSDDIASGHVKLAEGVTRLLNRREKQEFIRLLSQSPDTRKIAAFWAEGLLADWQGANTGARGKRMPLPTYPFAGKRHWVGDPSAVRRVAQGASAVHPLVDTNESTFERQLFRKTFHDGDFFIYDHHVADVPTLPGVAYLELARKAGELAAGRPVKRIQNILWVSPIAVQGGVPKEVLIELKPSGEAVQFEVFSEAADGTRTLHSQGKLLYTNRQDGEPEYVDLDAIRARCATRSEGATAYPIFKSVGLNLGPSFQVLQEVHKSADEVLGVLQLPEFRQADLQSIVLHPSLIDGSLQAGMAARLGDNVGEMLVPYSIGEVEILHPLQPRCFSYTTEAKDGKKGSRVLKSNVLILDETGKVLARIRESTGVPLVDVHKKDVDADAGFSTLYYAYEWQKTPLDVPAIAAKPLQSMLLFDVDDTLRETYRARLTAAGAVDAPVVLVRPGEEFRAVDGDTYELNPRSKDDFSRLFDLLAERNVAIENLCFAWPAAGDVDLRDETQLNEALERGVTSFLFVCQSVIARKLESKVQLLYVHSGQPHHDAVSGFVNTLRVESPKLVCKTLGVHQTGGDRAAIVDAVLAELAVRAPEVTAVRYDAQERSVRRFKPVALDGDASPAGVSLREKGVYLITGGAGGLGLIFAEYLANECKARLVLTGRSALSPEREARLEALRGLGAEVVYLTADVSSREDVARLVAECRSRFGELHGVIHSAGVLRDSYIRNKTAEEMSAVFAPKVFGTLHLDEATKDDALDFFVTFSSLAAVTGNAGQADYSFANSFMDAFAAERESLRTAGTRTGLTMSINWSLWAEGGMRPDEQSELYLRKTLGMKPLSTATGVDAFKLGLANGRSQFAVIEGIAEKWEQAWTPKKKEAAPVVVSAEASTQTATATGGGKAGDLAGRLQQDMTEIVMGFLKLDAVDVPPDKILLDLGFDSIGLTTFANAVNDRYQLDITPVLFFDYPSLEEIAKYLCAERAAEIGKFYQSSAPAAAQPAAVQPTVSGRTATLPEPVIEIRKGWNPTALDRPAAAAATVTSVSLEDRFVNQPIAIVGMSGVMPQSDDLDEFWQNLKESKDLVTVIPRDRWRWEDYDGDPLKETNKSSSKWGGFMKEVDKFDPLFFGMSPREAQMMDPQQRLFLEHAWKAVEDSGHKISDLAGTKTGLFVGAGTTDYAGLLSSRGVALDGYTASGNSHAVTANRISFLLNLRGPSAPIDTACSSSLVALHRAIESIHTGSSDMAIVGGVQVMLSPAAYISFSMAGMLSPDGKCKTFDKSANGYVRGEGCGAIFIKTLAAAEADGDHVYAVIRATAENHGGRVTTMTAPNSVAQTELLIEAYEKAHIDPSTVGYIECHGTGTGLGDPIEIQALSKAFSELYKRNDKTVGDTPHCGLSSVKTNIGHLETGAGIAGVLKVLLSMKNKQIPANLHLQEVNPYINLKGTPFYIADKLTTWEAPNGADGKPLPRRAGISSFGFGGANAHIVLEEYLTPKRPAARAQTPQLVVLSAKNAARLQAYVQSVHDFVQKGDVELLDLAYTLQVGRDEMPERLAVVASTTEELQRKLRAILDGGTADVYRGNVRNKAVSQAAEGNEALVQSLIERQELARLAELWRAGTKIDWRALHKDDAPRRISAPTYPFARERYWIPETPADAAHAQLGVAQLHPLVHRNISTLREQKFASRFTGSEFFLDDHRVMTEPVLPAVAYIEMAAAAGELAAEQRVAVIRNMTWMAPLTVGDAGQDVEVSLTPGEHEVEFTIKTVADGRAVTHCRGRLAYTAGAAEPAPLNVGEILQRCAGETIAGEDLYPFLSTSELKLGKAFQVVRQVYAAQSECIAVLQLPEHLRFEAERFGLHPSLLDGALHTAIGVLKKRMPEVPWSVPYAVAEIETLRSLEDVAYAHASWDAEAAGNGPVKIQIQLVDRDGRVLVRMTDFVAKPFTPPAAQTVVRPNVAQTAVLQSFQPAWTVVPPERISFSDSAKVLLVASGATFTRDGQDCPSSTAALSHLAWLREASPASALLQLEPGAGIDTIEQALAAQPFDQLLWIAPDVRDDSRDASLIEQQEAGVIAVFRTVKALLQLGYTKKKLQWTLITRGTQRVSGADTLQPAHAGIAGLIGSLAKEYPHWDLRLLDVDSLASLSARDCLTLPWDKQGNALALRNGEWFQQTLAPAGELPQATPRYRESGVYVVIGGAGGVGEVWSRFMIERYQANIVWVGRRERDEAIDAKLNTLGRIGPAPFYLAADATNAEALADVRRQILERFPAIHGVVHSALVLQDQSIFRMDEAAFRASFSAKADVSVNMDGVFGGDELDFMLFFSSIISFAKAPGQCNYAAGCTFKDSFAQRLQQQRPYPVKIMNWGYWGNVGVAADEFHNRMMAQMGIGSIEPAEGMAALDALVGSSIDQVVFVKTLQSAATTAAVAPAVAVADVAPAPKPRPTPIAAADATLAARTATRTTERTDQMSNDYIRQIVTDKLSEALRMDAAMIGKDAPFADYGVDSIIGVNLVRNIAEALEIELEPAILFECSTVEQLADYIAANCRPRVPRQLAAPVMATVAPVSTNATYGTQGATALPAHRFMASAPVADAMPAAVVVAETRKAFEPVAIVGMSGRFAESETLDAFWAHLAAGKDLVTKATRWREADGQPSSSHGSFIDSFDQFDPAFFRISAEEATYMDPQQRLFLEESWRALEDAGYAGKGAHEKQCGVYVGCGTSNYDHLFGDEPPAQAWWGNSQSVVPARIAYHLNLQGPAMAVDTACSSTLVAIHLACQSLWSGETEMALAGGVYVQATSGFHKVANRAGMLSPDGKCFSFDARANGFVPGEAVGVVVLKRLSDALRDGDHIHGVIAGSGINQDGKSNGLTAPNGRAQERLERAVYERFAINPETIQVIEAHGTGTLLGDSIEHAAITRSFREYTDRTQFCALGSVKTNIGHAGNAAGVASILKLVLSLKNRQIAPSLHFEKGSPAINFESSPFYVNTSLQDWRVEGDAKRRGAVSSFGFSGTNAHLVLEEPPAVERVEAGAPGYLVVLSARTPEQLKQQVRNLVAKLESTPDVSINDVSYSLAVGRMHLSHRLAVVARSRTQLGLTLRQWADTGTAAQVYTAEVPDGRFREQVALKKFGNYCIRECREPGDAATYLENLAAVAELHVQGYALDLEGLFPAGSKRVPLPTYPFARERYWVATTAVAAPARTVPAQVRGLSLQPPHADKKANAVETTWLFVREQPSTPGAVVYNGSMGAAEKMELFLKQETALQLQRPIDDVPINESYFDLGLTSLAIAHLIRNLSQLLDEDLSPSALFDYTDIRSLAVYLAHTYAGKIDTLYVVKQGSGEPHLERRNLHPAKLTPILRKQEAAPVAVVPELTREQVLEQVLWQDDALAPGNYDKETF